VKPNAAGDQAVIVARYDYDVYGAVRTQSGSSSNKFKYVAGIGHPTDEETGLIYMRARYYEPGVGRFVSEDPGLHGVNWYWYADANPVTRLDYDGKMTLGEIWSAFATAQTLVGGFVGFLSGFLSSIGSDYLNGNDINWANAVYQGGIWGLGGLLGTGLIGVIGEAAKAARVAQVANKGLIAAQAEQEYLETVLRLLDEAVGALDELAKGLDDIVNSL
jgi:RHS repeat-associated protein